MIGEPAIAVLNHLLAQSGWALPRLARFHGMSVRFKLFPFSLVCVIQPDGTLRAAPSDVGADASYTILPSLVPRLALRDEAALEQIEHAGDEALVREIFFLARNLRWDAAEDLSHITGDMVAERIVRLADGTHRRARDSALNVLVALKEYWTEERPLVAKPGDVRVFGRQVTTLQETLERLEERVGKLGRAPGHSR